MCGAGGGGGGGQQSGTYSPDTDALLLLLHNRSAFGAEELYLLISMNRNLACLNRCVNTHVMYEQLKMERHVILSIYCLTGFDTASSFCGHSKLPEY